MNRYLTQEQEQRIAHAYRSGDTARRIASREGRSKTTVLNVVVRLGIEPHAAAPRDGTGPNNPNWKGGRYIDGGGYVHVWTPTGYVLEHRKMLGVGAGVIVHHKDGNRQNNAPENLEAVGSHREHHALHVAEQRMKFGQARHPPPMRGEANPRAKITAAQAEEIRRLRGVVSQRLLAARFGVSKTAIRYAQTGRNWSSLREFPEAER